MYKEYSEILQKPPIKIPNKFLFFISIILIGISPLFQYLDVKFYIFSVLVGLILNLYFVLRLEKTISHILRSEEIEKIKQKYKEIFGEELTGIITLKTKLDEMKDKKTRLEALGIEKIKEDYEKLTNEIKRRFRELTSEDISEDKFLDSLEKLKKEKNQLSVKIQELESELRRLNVVNNEYEKNDPGVEFDENEYTKLKNQVEVLNDKKKKLSEIKNELEEINFEKNQLMEEINEWFSKKTGSKIESEGWEKRIKELEKQIIEKREEIRKIEGELKGLEIEPEEYLEQSPGVSYNRKELEEIEKQIKECDDKKKECEEKLKELKHSICNIVKKDFSTDWNDLFVALNELKKDKEKDFSNCVAKIVAGILLHQTIDELKAEEEKLLEQYLNSDEVKNTISQITNNKYKEFKIYGDDIFISDGFSEYNIKDISTGAKELILIGLRIGIAKKLLKDTSAFLILDDAIQHVDWKKRELIISELIKFAQDYQWQVFYFTMDNHVKEIFSNFKPNEKIEVFTIP